jgi:hypothetical protein
MARVDVGSVLPNSKCREHTRAPKAVDLAGVASRMERARKWVELAIATGHNPRFHKNGPVDSGEMKWGLTLVTPRFSTETVQSYEELPPLPRELWDELFQVCEALGRVHPSALTLQQAREWVEKAIASGRDPQIVIYPPWMKRKYRKTFIQRIGIDPATDPGEWPVELNAEIAQVLEEAGRVNDWRGEMPWNFQIAPDDCSAEAVAARLKLARETLGFDLNTFYAPTGLTLQTAKRWEGGKREFRYLGEKPVTALCKAHGINEFWLLCGGELPDKRGEAPQ